MEEKKIIAYKGFDENLCCRGFQYEVGKEYEYLGEVECHGSGFHACTNPLDAVHDYRIFGKSRFCIVEQSGDIKQALVSPCTTHASSKIKIKTEIGLEKLFADALEMLTDESRFPLLFGESRCEGVVKLCSTHENLSSSDNNTIIFSMEEGSTISSSGGYVKIGSTGRDAWISSTGGATIGSDGVYARICSNGNSDEIVSGGFSASIASGGNFAIIGSMGGRACISSSGEHAKIFSSGSRASISSSGNYALIESVGERAVICCSGRNSAVKAKKGSWITLSEREENHMCPTCVKTKYVDGDRIKADTWYTLTDGKFCEMTDKDFRHYYV